MAEIIVKTNRGFLTIKNLKEVWLQPAMMSSGIWLCYSDDNWERGHICYGYDRSYLNHLGKKIINAYWNNEVRVGLTD